MKLSDIDKQIAELEAKKRQLLEDEKKTALKKVELAVQELNALGFNYTVVQADAPKRRTGVRQDVLKAIKGSNGITPAEIAQKLDMDDTKGKQSISNALSALKKAGTVVADNGTYTAK